MIYLPNDKHLNLCFIFKRSATNPIFFKCYDYHFSVIGEDSLVHIFFILVARFVFLHCYQINEKATLLWQRMQCESKCSGSKWGGACGAHYQTPFVVRATNTIRLRVWVLRPHIELIIDTRFTNRMFSSDEIRTVHIIHILMYGYSRYRNSRVVHS